MGKITFELSQKQLQAYQYLIDDLTNELVYGGGARGGKSFLGSFWVIMGATRLYPGSSWLIAREELKRLKQTTMRTFFKVCQMLKIKQDEHYHFNAQDLVVTFKNGSVVFFAELKKIPTDDQFDRLGSYDLTGAWIDEAQEICKEAKDTLQFRFTEIKGYKWQTVPKTLYTCNPRRNWIFTDFWKPLIKDQKDDKNKKFVTALYSDNPYIDHQTYRDNVMRTKNKIKIERLLHGNFEYEDDPACLYSIDMIDDLFSNIGKGENRYITSDCSRKGRDKFIIMYWEGLQCKKVINLPYEIKSDSSKAKQYIINLADKHQVRRSNILLDSDGMGGPIVDELKCKGFINNGSPIRTETQKRKERENTPTMNYANIKTQCAFKLAELMEAGEIGIDNDGISTNLKEQLIEELQSIKQKDIDNDRKITLEEKDKVKERIGRSPDIYDSLMMRCFFELKPKISFVFDII